MGKKSRKAKAKTSDFQKVKLKVGKKRALPSNVTEVAFKSQAIYVPEQMKNVAIDETAASRDTFTIKRSVAELLNIVGHFNSNFRVDALSSLKNYFTNHKNQIQQYLPKIIEKVPKTIADEEQQVRKSSISFFKVIFSNLNDQEMSPFFDLLLSHLYCAMSHIYDDVQRDSLQIVDLCIEYFPNLLSHNAKNTLLQHFIELISTKRTNSADSTKGAKGDTGTTRVLSMKLSNKESSFTWRNRILKRLHDLLNVSVTSNKKTDKSGSWLKFLEENFEKERVNSDGDNGVVLRCDSNEIGNFLTHFESQKLSLPPFTLRTDPLHTISTLVKVDGLSSSPWKLILTLFPLLFDCWHEAVSDESKSFSAESIETMSYVLNIINLLNRRFLDSVDDQAEAIERIQKRYKNNFMMYFFDSFPLSAFTAGQPAAKKRKQSNQVTSSHVQSINLSICELSTTLALKKYVPSDSKILPTVATYLSMVLMSAGVDREQVLDAKLMEKCITAVKKLLDITVSDETKKNLLQPLLLVYQTLEPNSREKSTLLKFFYNLYSNENKSDIASNAVMTEWLCSLPELLIDLLSSKSKTVFKNGTLCLDSTLTDLTHLILCCIRLAFLRGNSQFSESWQEKKKDLLHLIKDSAKDFFCGPTTKGMFDDLCGTCAAPQAKLFEILVHHSSQISEEDITILSQICHKIEIVPQNVVYVAEMFVQRYQNTKSADEFVLLVKFLCSTIIGSPKDYLQSLQSSTAKPHSYTFDSTTKSLEFRRHSLITDKLCQILPMIEHLTTVLQHFLCQKILEKNQTLPVKTAYAILRTGEMLLKLRQLAANHSKNLSKDLGKLSAYVLMHCHVDLTTEPSVKDSLLEAVISLLHKEAEMVPYCIESMAAADMQDPGTWNSICSTIQYLASNTSLHKNFSESKDNLGRLLDVLKKFEGENAASSTFEATKLCVNLLLEI